MAILNETTLIEARKMYESGNSIKVIAKQLNSNFYAIRKGLLLAGVQLRIQSNFRDLTNQKFGSWTVLGRSFSSGSVGEGNARWSCRCDCGREFILQSVSLLHGTSKKCRKCEGKCRKDKSGPLPDSLWNRICKHAKSRGIPVTVTKEDCYNLFVTQNSKCALTGWVLILDKYGRTASLDRIDSGLGYSLGNVHWVHKDLNKMKWEFAIHRFREICQAVVLYAANNGELK